MINKKAAKRGKTHMGEAQTVLQVWLTTIECGNCAMVFAVPRVFYNNCREEGQSFRCPNTKCGWNSQTYTTSANQKLEQDLRRVKMQRDTAYADTGFAREQRDAETRRATAYKGHLTRNRKRSAAGVCPCCNRTFKQLSAHMANKHPGYGT